MIVNWKTASDNETTVIYGDSPTNLNVTVTGTTNIFSDTGYNNNYYYHTAKLPIFSQTPSIIIRLKPEPMNLRSIISEHFLYRAACNS
jgi:hypothetical protein